MTDTITVIQKEIQTVEVVTQGPTGATFPSGVTGQILEKTDENSIWVNKISNAEIKTQYELNDDTNVFSDADVLKLSTLDTLGVNITDKLDLIENQATADQTDAEIKTAYEANADTNNFDDAKQTKLAGIETLATADQTNAEIKTAYEANVNTNVFDDTAQTKLSGIEIAATADQTDLEIKTAYENNADTNNFNDSEMTKLAGIEPLATADQTNAEIKIAYEANADTNEFSDAEQTKLAGVADNANAYVHPNHTGDVTSAADGANTIVNNVVTNAKLVDVPTNTLKGRITALTGDPEDLTAAQVRTIIGVEDGATADQTNVEIKTAYEANIDTNVFDDALKTKLDGIEPSATADQTNAEIKTAYEANANTNEFSDTEQTKLAGIETLATADQTGAEIKTAYEGELDTNALTDVLKTKLDGIETLATADQTNAEIKTAYEANADTNNFDDAEQTKLAGIEALADVTDSTNVDAAGAVMNTDVSTALMAFVIDEDDFVSNSATKVPTQQSVKALVDAVAALTTTTVDSYDAALNVPNLDLASPIAVSEGDLFFVTADGTFFTMPVTIGDQLIAKTDNATAEADWIIVNLALDAASVKTSYESNADTNAFDDAAQTKLAGIPEGSLLFRNDIVQNMTSGSGIAGTGLANNNVAVFEFNQSNGTNRQGWVGVGSSGNENVALAADKTNADVVLVPGAGGNATVAGAVIYTTANETTPANIGALAVGAKAADSELLDGLDSTTFVRNDIVQNLVNTSGIAGTGTGTTNLAFSEFNESNGTTRQGFVGIGSSSNSDVTLGADVAGADVVLSPGAGGTASVGSNEIFHEGNIPTAADIGVEAGATADQTDAEIKTAYENNADTNAFDDAEQTKLAGIATSANLYVHPNHTGDVTSVNDGATTIVNNAVTNAKAADMVSNTMKGRVTVGTGDPEDLTATQVRTLLNVEDDATADQTNAEIKTAYEANADTNNFDDAEMTKLAGIEPLATADQTNAEIKTAYELNADTNEFSDAEQTKLAGIATAANLYVHPAHSGDVTSVADGATTIVNNAVTNAKAADVATNTIKGRVTAATGDPEDLTATQVRTLLNVEAGSTADQTDGEILTAYEANADVNRFTDTLKTKLDGLTGQSPAELKTAYESNLDTNAFDDTAVAKLLGIADNANLYVHPNHTGDVTSTADGATVIANNVVTNAKMADVSTATIKGRITAASGDAEDLTAAQARTVLGIEAGSTADQTDAEIKTAYENNANTNEYSDAEQVKLATIEDSATADQTGAEIKIAYELEPNTNAFTDTLKTKLDGLSVLSNAEIKTDYEANADTNAFDDAAVTKLAGIPDGSLILRNDITQNLLSASGIKGSGTGVTNSAFFEFNENNGTTRQGFIGIGSAGNSSVTVKADVAGADVILSPGVGGNATVDGTVLLTTATGLAIGAKAADSELLDGIDSTGFLQVGGAVDNAATRGGWGITPGAARYTGDLNTIPYTGVVQADVSVTTNEPAGALDGHVVTQYWDSASFGFQTFTDFHNQKMHIRQKNTSVWSSWAEVFTTVTPPTAAQIGVEAGADVTDATNVDAAGAVMNTDTSTAAMSFVIDEDDFSSDSATKVPTQQSVKAFIEATAAITTTTVSGYDAALNVPDLDVTPIPVVEGDLFFVTVAGTFFTKVVAIGDQMIAKIDNAAVEADWIIINLALDGASIKTTLFAVADTNNLTDVLKTKLDGLDDTLYGKLAGTQTWTGINIFDGAIGNSIAVNGVAIGVSSGGDPQIQLQGDSFNAHIDFAGTLGDDQNMRIINRASGVLDVQGGVLQQSGVNVLTTATGLAIGAKAADAGLLDGLDSTGYGRLATSQTWTGNNIFNDGTPAPIEIARATQVGVYFNSTDGPRYLGNAVGTLRWGTSNNHALNAQVYTTDFKPTAADVGAQVAGTYNTIIGTDSDISTTGASVINSITMTDGVITAHSARTLTLANLGYTGSTSANNYTHPAHSGSDINLDTGALGGATVISDLDFNVTVDTQGHVTSAVAAFSTRSLTAANIGAQAAGTYNTIIGTDSDINTSGSTIIDNIFVTDGVITSMGTRVLTAANIGALTTGGKAADSNLLDGVDSSAFMRSNTSDQFTSGTITFNDNVRIGFGTSNGEGTLYSNGTTILWDLGADDDIQIRDLTTSRFLFDSSSGNFHADGDVFAFSTSVGSDRKLKRNIETIENASEKMDELNGVSYILRKNGEADAGLIAQDVLKVLPCAVKDFAPFKDESQRRLNLNYNAVLGLVVAAFKEEKAKVIELEKRMTEMENR